MNVEQEVHSFQYSSQDCFNLFSIRETNAKTKIVICLTRLSELIDKQYLSMAHRMDVVIETLKDSVKKHIQVFCLW